MQPNPISVTLGSSVPALRKPRAGRGTQFVVAWADKDRGPRRVTEDQSRVAISMHRSV
jgi:hypothetical protein